MQVPNVEKQNRSKMNYFPHSNENQSIIYTSEHNKTGTENIIEYMK